VRRKIVIAKARIRRDRGTKTVSLTSQVTHVRIGVWTRGSRELKGDKMKETRGEAPSVARNGSHPAKTHGKTPPDCVGIF